MQYYVNNRAMGYVSEGDRFFGSDVVLAQNAADLTAGTPWHKDGYTIQPLFDEAHGQAFLHQTRALLLSLWQQAGLDIPDNFSPEQYHRLVTNTEEHLRAVEKTKLLPVDQFPTDIRLLEERISSLCGRNLVVHNPYDRQRIFHFRVIRPGRGDNNPLHRDVWLEDYSDCLNLYIPIAGSNALSSLILAPGSHLWPESSVERTAEGARINQVKFNVPAVTAIKGDYYFTRPDPAENEVLLFSPYLIHGGSVNLNQDITRISIEIRLWEKPVNPQTG